MAENQKEIDEKVDAYGGSGKSQRREMLNQTKVDKKDLGKLKEDKEKVNRKDVQATIVEKRRQRKITLKYTIFPKVYKNKLLGSNF